MTNAKEYLTRLLPPIPSALSADRLRSNHYPKQYGLTHLKEKWKKRKKGY